MHVHVCVCVCGTTHVLCSQGNDLLVGILSGLLTLLLLTNKLVKGHCTRRDILYTHTHADAHTHTGQRALSTSARAPTAISYAFAEMPMSAYGVGTSAHERMGAHECVV